MCAFDTKKPVDTRVLKEEAASYKQSEAPELAM